MRVTAWVMRFIGDCRSKKRERVNSPLTTQEINDRVVLFQIKRVQFRHESKNKHREV